jgi:hypothetical protein
VGRPYLLAARRSASREPHRSRARSLRAAGAAGGPEAWWRRYIDDPKFRLEQEIEAYRAQYASVASFPRPIRRELLAHIVKSLASGMYGKLVTKEQARRLVAGAAA